MIKDSDGEQRFYGIYRGVVSNANDPEKLGRVKLTIPQVLGSQETGWAWPYSPSGIHLEPPTIGQGAWAMFEGGDLSFPIWLGVFGETKNPNIEVSATSLPSNTALNPYLSVNYAKDGSKQLNLTETVVQLSTRGYGSFYDTTNQYQGGTTSIASPAVANTPTPIRLNTAELANGVSIIDGSKIFFSVRGVWNLQFSLQLDKTDSGDDPVQIWLRHEGVDVPWSNTTISVKSNNGKAVAAWNFLVHVTTNGQQFQIMWASTDANMRILASPQQTSPYASPGIPSVILTADLIGLI
jgi:hypothetical protein